MNTELYEEVHRLSVSIVNASEKGLQDLESEAYSELERLCNRFEKSDSNHPIQWEALGDFAMNHEQALSAYRKGLACSEKLGLVEYQASILFAMAECYLDQGSIDQAAQFALLAQQHAEEIDDQELKSAIGDFLK
jgi:tetratricopeptide (TPR) repeat protein